MGRYEKNWASFQIMSSGEVKLGMKRIFINVYTILDKTFLRKRLGIVTDSVKWGGKNWN